MSTRIHPTFRRQRTRTVLGVVLVQNGHTYSTEDSNWTLEPDEAEPGAFLLWGDAARPSWHPTLRNAVKHIKHRAAVAAAETPKPMTLGEFASRYKMVGA